MNTVGMMNRREILGIAGAGIASVFLPRCTGGEKNPLTGKTHVITLSFDDGFKKSFIKTAEIYEKYGLSACLNVLATVGLAQDAYQQGVEIGYFDLWNELQSRGHEIMPHGYRHANLPSLPSGEAIELIERCLSIFTEKLEGFDPTRAVFNFPYNASTPELERYLESRVMAFRTGGNPVNPFPNKGQVRLTCTSHGPENIDAHLQQTIDSFLAGPSGWLIYNTHGLDDEGWGPVSSGFLDELLDKYSKMANAAILPAGAALSSARLI